MRLYRDRGVVLRTIKLGEADRIVTVLTQGHGKVRAVAKGVRKTTSRFGARLEPTTHVALQCYEGRGDLDTITQVETIEANRPLREHYGSLTHAVTMLEATDQVAQEREPNPALYRMLAGALRTLAARPTPVVSAAFLWKLLSLEGYHPLLDMCARCGGAGELAAFDVHEGGVLCARCALGGGRRLAPETLVLVRQVLGGSLNDALAVVPGPATAELEHLAIAAVEHHIERRLRSAALL
jgi:DNA repair protein RecO (recombination protein O)